MTKQFIAFILFLCGCFAMQAQPIYKKSFIPNYVSDRIFQFNSSLYLVGFNNYTQRKAVILKTDFAGNAQWAAEISSHCNDIFIEDLIVASDGFIYAVGRANDSVTNCTFTGGNPFITKIDNNTGAVIHAKIANDYGGGNYSCIVESNSGELFILGNEFNTGNHYVRGTLLRLDTALNNIWQAKFENGYSNIQWNGFKNDTLGNLYVTGTRLDTLYYKNIVCKLDSMGNIIWSNVYDDGNETAGFQVMMANDGVYICGNHKNIVSIQSGTFILKLDTTGNIQWWRLLIGNGFHAEGRMYPFKENFFITPGTFCLLDSNANVIKTKDVLMSGHYFGFDADWNLYSGANVGFSLNKCDSNFNCCEGTPVSVSSLPITNFNKDTFGLSHVIYNPSYKHIFYSNSIQITDSMHCTTSIGFESNEVTTELLTLYPNPTTNYFYIRASQAIYFQDLSLFNNLGMNVPFNYSQNTKEEIEIRVELLPSGLYWLKIKNQVKPVILN
ncbi:MAG: T9SS type A sorting domain-containing protein [Bacteroidetes bacterium]|nr:T9SS type A sorting domain-containing protein [Bacteroidota bacterium]